MKKLFEYSIDALKEHFKEDEKMLRVIEKYGYIERYYHDDTQRALIETIIGQQISNEVLKQILFRFEKASLMSMENLAQCDPKTIQTLGVSHRKAKLLHTLSKDITSGSLNLQREYQQQTLRKRLLTYHGIGPWTVDMLYVFGFGHQDILSYHDFGVVKGCCLVYGLENITKKDFQKLIEKASPYGTYVSFYFWAIANEGLLS